MNVLRGLTTAVRTLTILPFPGREASPMSAALYWFPVVGLIVGGLQYLGSQAIAQLTEPNWPVGMAVAVIALGALLTRGLHLDGLADWADGASVMSGREKALEVMKDPRVGALGAVALILVVLAKTAAVVRLAEGGAMVWVIAACVISRAMQVDLAAALPYARATGGTAAWFVEDARLGHAALAIVAALVVSGAMLHFAGIVAVLGAWLLTRLFGIWCKSRLGGVTGDLLGACSELVETGILIGAALRIQG